MYDMLVLYECFFCFAIFLKKISTSIKQQEIDDEVCG